MNTIQKMFKQLSSILGILIFASGCSQSNHAEVKKKKIDDIEIAYYTRGKGPPLLMIMGFRGTMGIWDPALLNELEKNYTLILFDNRGAGLSSDTEQNLTTIPQMAEDTAHLIQALGYQKVNVLGWSMGSRIAQQLTSKYPELVDKLILCSPNPGGKYGAPRTTDAYQKLTSKNLSDEEALSLLYPNTAEGHRAAAAYVARLTATIIEKSVPDDLKISDQTIERQKNALDLWDQDNIFYDSLAKMKTPTLVAGGQDDVLDSPDNVRIVADQIPFAWSAYIPGAGHAFLSQEYIQCSLLIKAFIDQEKLKD